MQRYVLAEAYAQFILGGNSKNHDIERRNS